MLLGGGTLRLVGVNADAEVGVKGLYDVALCGASWYGDLEGEL